MTRKKVKLAYIVNDSARKATYKKRKRGFLKKMDELTTLCDVKACAVMYSQYESRPVVWPNHSEAREVISSFKRLPEMEKAKKMVSQEEFLRQRVAKAHEQLKKQQRENREKEMTHVMYQCLTGRSLQNMSLLDLSDLSYVIDQYLNEINRRLEILNKDDNDDVDDNPNPNINANNNNSNDNIINDNNNMGFGNANLQQAMLGQTQAVGMGPTAEGLAGHEAMQMQMMMQQPWSSFMDMMNAPPPAPLPPPPPQPPVPPMMNEPSQHGQHYQHHPQMGMGMEMEMTGFGMGGGFNAGGGNDGASSSNGGAGGGNNVNMNMMMMMMSGQFTSNNNDNQFHGGHGVNNPAAMWSNNNNNNNNNNNGFFP